MSSSDRRVASASDGSGPKAALSRYRAKRDFAQTPEPSGDAAPAGQGAAFVVQKHDASTLHYDFRLELDGTLKSWAIPKGPSLDPAVKRMAVEVEDHPLSYASFEGVIPEGHYGAGIVVVWDSGRWTPVGDAASGLREGHLKFELDGHKLHGRWALVRMKPRAGKAAEKQPAWLLIKDRDDAARPATDYDVVKALPDSVLGTVEPPSTRAAGARRKAGAARLDQRSEPASDVAVGGSESVAKTAPRVTHADRVIDPSTGITKGELVDYFGQAAASMLPHLSDRPIAMVRAPRGVAGAQFFQKHAQGHELAGMASLPKSLDPEHDALLVVRSAEGLVSAAQMNVVEIHTWNMTAKAISKPDRMVFDLDPGEGVDWNAMREGATLLRSFLGDIGLSCRLKTSGGKGLHLVVPLSPRADWQAVAATSEAVVARMAEVAPQRFVAKSGPRYRVGKIFIDYLRNGWGATTAAAWSPRARPGLGVSVPLGWDELGQTRAGDQWTIRNVAERLAIGNEPWGDAPRQTLTKAMKALDLLTSRNVR